MAAEPDSEIYSEPDEVVQERTERALRAESVSLFRATRDDGDPTILLMLGLAENDVLYPMSLADARWLAGELMAAVKAMGGDDNG